MNSAIDLFTPVQLGPYQLPNRFIMAPLTRNRANEHLAPTALNATYYSQRASAGLIITEATQISQQGQGYPGTPGIYSPAQIAGWRQVTEAVHDQGGRIFLQLWHVGRISAPELQPNGNLPVAPSAIAAADHVTPRALETAEISDIIQDYRQAAENALAAGFDGVEVHSANGYLLDQFLQDGSNHRTDEYGGSIENRARLLLNVLEAVTGVWGSDRVGVRLSPSGTFNDMSDSDPKALFSYVINALNPFNLAYLHLVEPRVNKDALKGWEKDPNSQQDEPELGCQYFRSIFTGNIISAGGYDKDLGNSTLAAGNADLIAYGRLFISNPDLPKRFALNAPLNPYDRSTFYGGTEKGYTDYPTLELQSA